MLCFDLAVVSRETRGEESFMDPSFAVDSGEKGLGESSFAVSLDEEGIMGFNFCVGMGVAESSIGARESVCKPTDCFCRSTRWSGCFSRGCAGSASSGERPRGVVFIPRRCETLGKRVASAEAGSPARVLGF